MNEEAKIRNREILIQVLSGGISYPVVESLLRTYTISRKIASVTANCLLYAASEKLSQLGTLILFQ